MAVSETTPKGTLSKPNNQDSIFKIVDDALSVYFQKLDITNYKNSNGMCRFMQYIMDEKLNDSDLPIEHELGDECNPTDCAYSWMNNVDFPMPRYVNLKSIQQKEAFIFYIQYCFKHSQCPTDQYIKQYLLPKIEKYEISPSLSEQKNNRLYIEDEEGVTKNGDIAEIGEFKGPGFNDIYEGEGDINNDDEYVFVLEPLIEIQLRQSINKWHSCSDREAINLEEILDLFMFHNINYLWFEQHTRRDFMNLLKEELGVPKAASTRIWKDFQQFVVIDESTDSVDQYKEEFEQDPYLLIIEIEENLLDNMVIINQLAP